MTELNKTRRNSQSGQKAGQNCRKNAHNWQTWTKRGIKNQNMTRLKEIESKRPSAFSLTTGEEQQGGEHVCDYTNTPEHDGTRRPSEEKKWTGKE